MALIAVEFVKQRLNKTTMVDDIEIADMIDAAEAEYAQWVGPMESKTLRYDGGSERLILPRNVTAVTAVTYADGTVVSLADLDFDADTGLLGWNSGATTSGLFGYGGTHFASGHRNVLVTMTVAVPANHREAIIADVAGYFAATQRGGGQSALPTNGYEAAYVDPGTPLNLFPRIRALAATQPKVA